MSISLVIPGCCLSRLRHATVVRYYQVPFPCLNSLPVTRSVHCVSLAACQRCLLLSSTLSLPELLACYAKYPLCLACSMLTLSLTASVRMLPAAQSVQIQHSLFQSTAPCSSIHSSLQAWHEAADTTTMRHLAPSDSDTYSHTHLTSGQHTPASHSHSALQQILPSAPTNPARPTPTSAATRSATGGGLLRQGLDPVREASHEGSARTTDNAATFGSGETVNSGEMSDMSQIMTGTTAASDERDSHARGASGGVGSGVQKQGGAQQRRSSLTLEMGCISEDDPSLTRGARSGSSAVSSGPASSEGAYVVSEMRVIRCINYG